MPSYGNCVVQQFLGQSESENSQSDSTTYINEQHILLASTLLTLATAIALFSMLRLAFFHIHLGKSELTTLPLQINQLKWIVLVCI